MIIFVTGAAGFIGYHLTKRLLDEGKEVIAIDNLNTYYDLDLKKGRLKNLYNLAEKKDSKFNFYEKNIEDKVSINEIFKKFNPEVVINLAAQAGVRYSLENPYSYAYSNLFGFINIYECCKDVGVKHFIYASSSSVYGENTKLPFKESDSVDNPISLYAATKRSNELISHSYSHLFNIPSTGLRFFTAYGPWGRPDMALFKFTKAIIEDKPIDIYNNGNCKRDFTYIDDVIESIFRLIDKAPIKKDFQRTNNNPHLGSGPFQIFNIGNSKSINLLNFIHILEEILGKKAKKNFLPLQPGDVIETLSDSSSLEELIKFKPNTSLKSGIEKFVDWYKTFYQIS